MDKSVNSAAFPLPDNRLHPLPRRQAFSRIPARSLSACGFFARRSITPCSGHACQSAQRTSHNYTGHRHPPSYRICLCVHDLTPFALHLRLAAFHNKHPCSGTGNGRSRRQRHDLSANIAPVSETIRQHTGTAQPRCFPVSPLSGRPNDGTPGHAVTSPHAGQFARHPAPNRAQHDSCPAPFCYPYATANGQVPSACAPFTAYP